MKRILEGVRILDWSVFHVGPYAGAMLADLGADVIHLEHPVRGDGMRGLETLYGINLVYKGRHVQFEEHNRNKRGLAVDLSKERGREVIYRLIQTTDVFLTNYRPQAITRMGVDYEVLNQFNPRLIYAQASGFGVKGPEAENPSIDLIAQAKSGMMLASGEEGDPPVFLSLGIADRLVSFVLAYGVMAALLARERFGIGQKVETSQLIASMIVQGNGLIPALVLHQTIPRHSHKRPPRNPLYNYFKCKDGRWIVIASWQQRYWVTFCKGIGMPELENNPRYADMDARMENREQLVELLDKVFLTKTSDEWSKDLRAAGDLLFIVPNSLTELASDPQVIANDYVINWAHPVLGNIQWPGFAVKFTKTPAELRNPAPELGQHTEEILLEIGYDWDDINRLQEEGVL